LFFTNSKFVVLVKQIIWNITINITFGWTYNIYKWVFHIIFYNVFTPQYSHCIPKIFTSFFGWLCNIHIVFLDFSLFFWPPMQYLHMGLWNVHHRINQLSNNCILTCFPTSKFAYMWILHVSCSTCGFGIILMWVLHFEVEGPPKVSLDQQMLVSAWPLCRFYILGN
jgi:hypothetical protein